MKKALVAVVTVLALSLVALPASVFAAESPSGLFAASDSVNWTYVGNWTSVSEEKFISIGGVNMTWQADDYPLDVSKYMDVAAVPARTYTGKPIKPTLTVTTSRSFYSEKLALTEGTHYTVTYKNNVNAGTATAIVKGKGDFTGSKSITFMIKPKSVTPTVTLAASKYTYNKKTRTPAVKKVTAGKTALTKNDYTVVYDKGRTAVGTYKVAVRLKGNYSGIKTSAFQIVPKGTLLRAIASTKKGFVAKWARQSTKMTKSRVTGYQLQYSLNNKFKGAKSIKVKGWKNNTKKITKLKTKKKYYVRVRTYMKAGGKLYYSPWTKAKKVKTK